MREVFKFCFAIIVVSFISCEQNVGNMSPSEYVSFIEANNSGYKRIIKTGDYRYNFQYRPTTYIAFKELGVSAGQKDLLRRVEVLDSTVWFNVGLEVIGSSKNPLKNNVSDLEEYQKRLDYFLRIAESNFTLLYDGEPMKKIAYHFENNYGLTPMDMIVLGYKIPDKMPDKNMTLIYNDELFNNGIMKISLTEKEIRRTLYQL